jgi:hypothetical protein
MNFGMIIRKKIDCLDETSSWLIIWMTVIPKQL